MRQGFVLYTRYRDFSQIRSEIDDVIMLIPFGRVDGLNVSIDRTLDGLRQDIFSHVPGAVRKASMDVTTLTLEQVRARVRAGDVVVR
jgi:hypothetical protein